MGRGDPPWLLRKSFTDPVHGAMGGKGKRVRQREAAEEKKRQHVLREELARSGGGQEGQHGRGEMVATCLWVCAGCGYRNWTTRVRCNACTRGKTCNAVVVEEMWRKDRIPPGVVALSASSGHGCPFPAPTGRRPIRFNEATDQQQRQQPQQPQQPQQQQQAQQPSQQQGHQQPQPQQQPQRQHRPPQQRQQQLQQQQHRQIEDDRKPDQAEQTPETATGKQDSAEKLPPERQFTRPALPREALVQKMEREEARIGHLRDRGAPAEKVHRAEARKKETGEQLRTAGGKTPQSLGFQIRREEEYKRKATAEIERGERRVAERLEQIRLLQEQIDAERALQERHTQRCEAAEQRLAWLAMQKAKESLPECFLQRVSAAAQLVASSEREEFAPLKELFAVLLASPQGWDITTGDTSEDSDGYETEEWMGHDGREVREDIGEFEEAAQQEVIDARDKVSCLQAQYKEALDRAFEGRPRAAKRALGDDQPKASDIDMEEEQVATLGPEQTVQFYRDRLREEQARLDRVEQAARKEKVLVLPQGPQQGSSGSSSIGGGSGNRFEEAGQQKRSEELPAQMRNLAHSKRAPQESQQSNLQQQDLQALQLQMLAQQLPPSPPAERALALEEGARQTLMGAEEEIQMARQQIRERTEATMQILLQERMQVQQELELQGIKKMEVVRREAAKIAERVKRAKQC